jgi:hypothetical protein
MLMEVEIPIPPNTTDSAAPDRAPLRRFNYLNTINKRAYAPPCLREALRGETFVLKIHWDSGNHIQDTRFINFNI